MQGEGTRCCSIVYILLQTTIAGAELLSTKAGLSRVVSALTGRAEMSGSRSDNDPIRVSVILSGGQLRWRSVRFLLDGLVGPLAKGEVLVHRGATHRRARGLAGMLALERALLRKGLARDALNASALPEAAGQIAPCDVIVDLRPGPAPADLCARARFGVWQFSCHDDRSIAAAMARGASAVTCEIYRQTADDPVRRVMCQTLVQGKHAIAPTQAFASEKTVQLALHMLRRLAMSRVLPPATGIAAFGDAPAVRDLARYGLRMFRQAVSRLGRRLLPGKGRAAPFGLRTGKGDLPDLDPGPGTDLPQPEDVFRADPFLFENDGEVFCFFEEFPFETGRGKIAVARLHEGGAEPLGDALVTDYHLSFPFVFRHEGEIFLMPETLQADRLEIWRCTEFPLKWERHATAFEGQGMADPVLFQSGDAWWLFANTSHDSFGDFSSELSLFRVDGPDLGKIVPHPLNPVVVGSDVARGGGRVFERDGRLYRFSQDNSGDIYGYGLNLMNITELSESGYEERRIAHFTPDRIPGALGCHHADAVAGWFVVDVRWP